MFQVNKIPNRMNRFLDLVFCNEPSVMPSVDHALILNESIFHLAYGFQINSCLNNNLKLQIEDVYYDFKHANYEAINYHICQINWDAVFMFKDVNEALNSFYCMVHNNNNNNNKIIHMNLAVKFNLLKDTQPHYIYKPESCLENDNYKLYFDRTVLTDIHIQHNRPDIIILNKQQKHSYLLDIAVPNSHNITQTYNTKINKYLELSVAMRNLWCLEKMSILPFIISATGIVPQSLFKNLKILHLENTLVVEIQKGILLYSCHIVRKFLNIDTEHKTQKSQNVEARRR
jgi:hypothetical protein